MCVKTEIVTGFDLFLAVQALKSGQPIAFPTETVYGLGAPVFEEEAVRKIFAIKGRPSDNPLIVHIHTLEEAIVLSDSLPPFFYMLAESFWPGPLTMIVKASAAVPKIVSAGLPTVAIRMPAHPLAQRLLREVGQPLAAPSANISGRPSPTSASDVLEDLNGKVPYIIDGGACMGGIESTVVYLSDEGPKILRPGKIGKEMLEEVLKMPVALATSGPILSPGMKYRHYAPKARVKLVYCREELPGSYLIPTQRSLYADLRRLDREGFEEIAIYCDETAQKDVALMNRLLRAAGQIS